MSAFNVYRQSYVRLNGKDLKGSGRIKILHLLRNHFFSVGTAGLWPGFDPAIFRIGTRRLYVTDVSLMATMGLVYIVILIQIEINITGEICDMQYSLMAEDGK